MRGLLTDGGGIYMLGRNAGSVIESNLIHDIISYLPNDGAAIYLDEGSSCIRVRGNICYGCNTGFHQHYGESNELVNNLFAFNNHSCVRLSRPESHLSFFAHNNIFVVDSGVDFTLRKDGIYHFNQNLLVLNPPAEEMRYEESVKMNDFYYAHSREVTASAFGDVSIENMGVVEGFNYTYKKGGGEISVVHPFGSSFDYLEPSCRSNVGCDKEDADGFYNSYVLQFNDENTKVCQRFSNHSKYFEQTISL